VAPNHTRFNKHPVGISQQQNNLIEILEAQGSKKSRANAFQNINLVGGQSVNQQQAKLNTKVLFPGGKKQSLPNTSGSNNASKRYASSK